MCQEEAGQNRGLGGDVSDMARMLDVGRVVKKKMEVGSTNKIQFSLHREEREGVVGPLLML